MRRLLSILLSLVLLFFATFAQAAFVADVDPDFAVGGPVAGARVENLPNDMSAWYCTVFSETGPSSIVDWFSSNAKLARLRQQTHWNHITPSSSVWSRYWEGMQDANGIRRPPLIGQLPAVVLQKPVGGGGFQVVARFQGNSSHLDNAENLSRALSQCIRQASESTAAETFATNQTAGGIFSRTRTVNVTRECRPCQPYRPDPGPDVPDIDVKPAVPDIDAPEEVREVEAEEKAQHEFWAVVALVTFVAVFVFAYVKDRQAQTY